MRPIVLIALTALALGACRDRGSADDAVDFNQNLTAENIASNDVTAIDAVTADAANIAADVDYTDTLNVPATNSTDAAKPAVKSGSAKPTAKPAPSATPRVAPPPDAASNTATNAQ